MTLDKEYYRFTEVAELLGCSKSTLYRWIREGKFPNVKRFPGGKRWSRETITRFLDVSQPTEKELKILSANIPR